MATSNTYTFNMTVMELIEDAIQQCGLPSSAISAEIIRIALRQLNLLQQELVNRGVNLWALSRELLPLYPGQREYTLPERTVDLISVQVRRVVRNATTTSNNGTPFSSGGGGNPNLAFDDDFDTAFIPGVPVTALGFQYTNPQFLSTMGFRPFGDFDDTDVILQASQDGVTYSDIVTVPRADYLDNQWYWFDAQSRGDFPYWRVSFNSAAFNNIAIRELSFSYNDYEIQTAPYNRDDYWNLPFKATQGRSYNYWYDRQAPNPKLWLWPSPNNTYELFSLLVHRHVQDVASVTDNLEIPRRWLDVFSTGLAMRLARQIPQAAERIPLLKQFADEAMNFAELEETDRSPIYFEPSIGRYTRGI